MSINTLSDLKISQNFLTRCNHSYNDLPLFVSLKPSVFYELGLDEDGIYVALSITEDLYKGEGKFPITCMDSNENIIKFAFSFGLTIIRNNKDEALCYIAIPLSADFKRFEQGEHDYELKSEGTNYYNPVLIID
jgi:hypothetical protein